MESALGHNRFVRIRCSFPVAAVDHYVHYGLVVGGNGGTASLVLKYDNEDESSLWYYDDTELTVVDDVPPAVRELLASCLSPAAQERILLHRHRAFGHCFTFDGDCLDEEHRTCCSLERCDGHTCTPAAVPALPVPRMSKRTRTAVARYQP